MELIATALGFAGFLALSVPAFYANKYARLLAQHSSLGPLTDGTGTAHTKAENSLKDLRDSWTSWKSFCLIGGTILVILSYLVQLIKICTTA